MPAVVGADPAGLIARPWGVLYVSADQQRQVRELLSWKRSIRRSLLSPLVLLLQPGVHPGRQPSMFGESGEQRDKCRPLSGVERRAHVAVVSVGDALGSG